MTDTPWIPSTELLDELALILTGPFDTEPGGWFDRTTRELVFLQFDPFDGLPKLSDPSDEFAVKQRELATRILAEPDRYIRFDSGHDAFGLWDFLDSVEDKSVRDRLRDASDGGRGAFRRVRNALDDMGLQQLWWDFETRANRQLARDWLQEHGLVAEDVGGLA